MIKLLGINMETIGIDVNNINNGLSYSWIRRLNTQNNYKVINRSGTNHFDWSQNQTAALLV